MNLLNYKAIWRITKVAVFQLLVLFWVVKIAYAVRAYFVGGMVGVRGVILHGGPIPANPADWGHPRWGVVALRYSVVAMLTLVAGLISRQELKQWWTEIYRGRF